MLNKVFLISIYCRLYFYLKKLLKKNVRYVSKRPNLTMVGGGAEESGGARVEQGSAKAEESSSQTTRPTACSLGRHYKAVITYLYFHASIK